jgi:hypothetical protein
VSDGQVVFASSDDGAMIATVATDEPPVAHVLTEKLISPRGIAADPWFVYTVNTGDASVVAVSRRSGTLTVVSRGGDPFDVAVTNEAVWFADRGASALVAVPKIGGAR